MAAEDVLGLVESVLGKSYEVKAVVGQGAYSVVYRAHETGLRAPVALKCVKLPAGLDEAGRKQFMEQFRGDAELLFKLSGAVPTVARPLAVDAHTTDRGVFIPYVALEWVDGQTLNDAAAQRRAAGQPFTVGEILRLLKPVAGALAQAHRYQDEGGARPIVHGDVKPENIFVMDGGGDTKVKMIDFGTAKVKRAVREVATRLGAAIGTQPFTPAFAAPEQWAPDRLGTPGPATDVWGLALTIVEVLAGRELIQGDASAMMQKACDPARRPTPRTEGVTVTDAIEAVFQQALAVQPAQRQANVGEFWKALVSAVEQAKRGSVRPAAPATPMAMEAIPDLEVSPSHVKHTALAPQEQMSVMEMDEFGIEGETLDLDLDLAEGESLTVRDGDRGGTPAEGDGAAPAEGEAVPPSEAVPSQLGGRDAAEAAADGVAKAALEPPQPVWHDRLLDAARDLWDEDSPLWVQLIPGVVAAVLALLITVGASMSAADGEELEILGMSPGTIAAPFLLLGLGWVGYRVYLRYR